MSDYDLLKSLGHSPAKAAEIVLDATRGDDFSRRWIEAMRHGGLAKQAVRDMLSRSVEAGR